MVSIIIPVYNTENYLKRCVDSVISQTYRNMEIILVDDGSTDGSGQICKKYQESDNRVKYIKKGNGGLSDARNVGMASAQGDYLLFVDSDDYVEDSYVGNLVRSAEEQSADVVLSDAIMERRGKNIEYKNETLKGKEKVFNAENAIKVLINHKGLYGSPWTAWGKLYSRRLFEGVLFPVGKLSEDLAVIPKVIASAKQIVYIPQRGYHYALRDGSIINVKSQKLADDNYIFASEIKDFFINHFPDISKDVLAEYIWMCMQIALMSTPNEGKYSETISMLRKYGKYFLMSDRRKKYKILLILLIFFPDTVNRLYK